MKHGYYGAAMKTRRANARMLLGEVNALLALVTQRNAEIASPTRVVRVVRNGATPSSGTTPDSTDQNT